MLQSTVDVSIVYFPTLHEECHFICPEVPALFLNNILINRSVEDMKMSII